MKETWRFINSGPCSPAYNMALDEALLNWHSEGKIPPTIRFYTWDPPTLSIGYFQKVEKEINMEKVREYGLGFVRRPTGGRSVLHDKELTYSVIVSEDHPDMPHSVTEAYRVISQGILEGFKAAGLDAYFAIPRTEEERNELKNPRSSVCFDAPSWYELVVEGKKIAGSAQTRQKGVILQHGAILRHLDIDRLISLFRFPSEEAKQRMYDSLPQRAVAIDQLTERDIPIDELVRAFSKGFEKALHITLQPYTLTKEQEEEVHQLMEEKYANDAWNYLR